MLLKPVFIIAIVVAMIGVMIPSVFAVEDNVTIEGNLTPFNRSEELYVAKFDPVVENTEITFSIYDSIGIIFSSTSHINSGGTSGNFYVKFFPPLFEDNTDYTISVIGNGLVGRQIIAIKEQIRSHEPEINKEESERQKIFNKLVEEEEARMIAEAKSVEEARMIAEAKAVEEARMIAEAKAVEEARMIAEAKAVEEARIIAEAKSVEEARIIAEAKAVEEARMNTITFIVIFVIILILLIVLAKRKKMKKKPNKNTNKNTNNNWKKDDQDRIFCTNCGNKIINSTQFCTNCGKSQSREKTYEYNESEITLNDCYEILELTRTATALEIKAARNRLVIQWHPDKHRTLDRKLMAENETKKINAAYEKLRKAGKLG